MEKQPPFNQRKRPVLLGYSIEERRELARMRDAYRDAQVHATDLSPEDIIALRVNKNLQRGTSFQPDHPAAGFITSTGEIYETVQKKRARELALRKEETALRRKQELLSRKFAQHLKRRFSEIKAAVLHDKYHIIENKIDSQGKLFQSHTTKFDNEAPLIEYSRYLNNDEPSSIRVEERKYMPGAIVERQYLLQENGTFVYATRSLMLMDNGSFDDISGQCNGNLPLPATFGFFPEKNQTALKGHTELFSRFMDAVKPYLQKHEIKNIQ